MHMPSTTITLQELNDCSANTIPEWLFDSDAPCVLKGLVKDWPAVKAWHAGKIDSYLLGLDQSTPMTVYHLASKHNGRIFYNEAFDGFNFTRLKLPLAEVLSNIAKKADTYYVGSTLIDHWLPGFRQQNPLDLFGREHLASIWLGNQCRVAAHYDFPSNIACAVAGRRRFTLFHPSQLENLYLGPLDFTPSGQPISLVDFANPDLQAHPKFVEARKSAMVVDLEPGDALYIPSMWLHHVESLDDLNVLVNYWWRSTPAYHGAPNTALLHALLAISDLPKTQRETWRALFNHYVFDEPEIEHIPEVARGVLGEIDQDSAKNIRALITRFLR